MNRFFSTLAVLTMALVAIAICVRHTFDIRGTLDETTTIVLFVAEALVAVCIVAAGVWLVRTEYLRHKDMPTRSRFEIAQPLRRLFSTVWS